MYTPATTVSSFPHKHDARFVVAQIAEHFEAAGKLAIQLALDGAGGAQMRRQLLQEADGFALTAPSNVLNIVHKANKILAAGQPSFVH